MRWCRGAQGWDAGDGRRFLAAATNSQGAEDPQVRADLEVLV